MNMYIKLGGFVSFMGKNFFFFLFLCLCFKIPSVGLAAHRDLKRKSATDGVGYSG